MMSTSTGPTTASSRAKAPGRRLADADIASTWVVLATLALAALALAAHSAPYFGTDIEIARAVQSYRPEWFSLLMPAGSWPGLPPQINILFVMIFVWLYFAFSAGKRCQAYASRIVS